LEYESYIPLALKMIRTIMDQVRTLSAPDVPAYQACFDHVHHHHQRQPSPSAASQSPADSSGPSPAAAAAATIEITHVVVYHLLGDSPVLTPSIVICVSAPHRKDAFVACEWVLEQVKLRVPVWKREWYADGTVFHGRDGEGVEGTGNRPLGGGEPAKRPEMKPVWKENFPAPVNVAMAEAKTTTTTSAQGSQE
jgi:molybdopterin synthase catalytic subunit